MQKGKKAAHLVRVSPVDVRKMNDEELVIVNRTQINVRLAVECRKKRISSEKVMIMQNAVETILAEERIKKRVVTGAYMSVADVKKVFGQMKSVPNNTFMRLEN